MARSLIYSLLIAALLGQGWAQAAMPLPEAASTQADCAGHTPSDTGPDCCPDGAMAAGGCASACSAAFALATVAPEVVVSPSQYDSTFLQLARAGPRYLPLNPPPIA